MPGPCFTCWAIPFGAASACWLASWSLAICLTKARRTAAMFRQFREPQEWEYDTQEEYLEALEAYEAEMQMREYYLVERRLEKAYI